MLLARTVLAGALLTATAAPMTVGSASAEDPAFLTLGVGAFDVIRNDNSAGDFRIEYRHDDDLFYLKPWAGVEVTSDSAIWIGAGSLVDIYFGNRVVLTGSVGAGYYNNGDGPDLGYALEFRSGVELGYRFDNYSRLSVGFSHISNADLGDRNPGTEIISVNYSIPIGRIFGDDP